MFGFSVSFPQDCGSALCAHDSMDGWIFTPSDLGINRNENDFCLS